MSIPYEILSALEDRYLPSEIVEMLCNIDKEDIREYAVENWICPLCFNGLEIRTWKEPRNEHFGMRVSEEMSELVCCYCNWIEND